MYPSHVAAGLIPVVSLVSSGGASLCRFIKSALMGWASLIIPLGDPAAFELAAVGDVAGPLAPPSLLAFEPEPITTNGVVFGIGLGIRP